MILIITHKEDFTVDFVVNKLNERGVAYVRLNCEDIENESYDIRFDREFHFNLVGSSEFDAVWFRRIKIPPIESSATLAERQFLAEEYNSFIQNLMLTLDARWLSYPTSIYAAENKLFQLKKALALGFRIPETLVTNDTSKVIKFHQAKSQGIVAKPISSNKIIDGDTQRIIFTNKLSPELIESLSSFSLTPMIFQEYISKQYEVRVTVVANKVFSAQVMSQSEVETQIDWRRKQIPFSSYKLPASIEEKCVRLVNVLGLSFGAIDLIKSEDGQYYFLEINPNGQWVWIETDTGLPISEAIISFLNE